MRPDTVSDLTKAQREATALKAGIPEIEATMDRCERKNRLLRSFGSGVDTTAMEVAGDRWRSSSNEKQSESASEMRQRICRIYRMRRLKVLYTHR